jgi:hypothetical protein
MQNEAWVYGTEKTLERMVEIMNGAWRGEGFSVDCRDCSQCICGRNAKESTSGGSVVGREKVCSLAFTDDRYLVAKSEREMKEIMRSLGKYTRKKKLVVNVEKRKMLVFHKRKRKDEKRGVELRRNQNRTSK